MEEAALADRVVIVDNGRIAADNPPKKIFADRPLLEKCGLTVPEITEVSELLAG